MNGVDWLHTAVEAELADDAVAYNVESRRDATHIGASGEIAAVALILLGKFAWSYASAFGARLGEGHAEAALEWARRRSRAHRKAMRTEAMDGPPDFFERDPTALGWGMAAELADVAGVPKARLALLGAERSTDLALRATYRDTETGEEYEVIAGRDWARFRRVTAPNLPDVDWSS
jgi:hypothetical protein